jgi:hypothetical protein
LHSFGIGDDRLQRAVLEAQERAVGAGMAYLERHACRTRMGAGGHQVIDGAGFVGAVFGRRTSRAGDPQIHTHVLVSNATRRPDGLQWRVARNGIADVEGVPDAAIEAFSRRRAEIDAQVAEWGARMRGRDRARRSRRGRARTTG